MDAYTVAGEMLGGMELTPMQVAQLRAIDHEHQQRLFALLHAAEGEPARTATSEELAALRASLQSAVLGILTPRAAGAAGGERGRARQAPGREPSPTPPSSISRRAGAARGIECDHVPRPGPAVRGDGRFHHGEGRMADFTHTREVRIPAGGAELDGTLSIPPGARGVVLFAHGSGSGRFSPRSHRAGASLGMTAPRFGCNPIDEEPVKKQFQRPRRPQRTTSVLCASAASG